MNATPTKQKGIQFRSKLEANCYKKLLASGLSFEYEAERITLWVGKNISNVPLYEQKKHIPLMVKANDNYKLRDMTYTPDFIIKHKNFIAYVDSKGHVTDMYSLKKKMFLQHLSERNDNLSYLFFEPRNLKQMDQVISIIKKL